MNRFAYATTHESVMWNHPLSGFPLCDDGYPEGVLSTIVNGVHISYNVPWCAEADELDAPQFILKICMKNLQNRSIDASSWNYFEDYHIVLKGVDPHYSLRMALIVAKRLAEQTARVPLSMYDGQEVYLWPLDSIDIFPGMYTSGLEIIPDHCFEEHW